MGRAGSGGGGGHHSSGGHSSSRSSGGHHVGGDSRAGSHSSYSSSSHHSSYRSSGSYRYNTNIGPVRYYGNTNPIYTALVLIVMLIIVGVYFYSSTPHSTVNREPLENTTYYNNYIVDEIGWFDNISSTERKMKTFYDNTGVQPYVVLHAYDPTLTSDYDKEQWANDYYNQNIHDEDTFLYVYFAEEDVDNDVGYMCYVNGKRVSSVMDSEAIDIFWQYIDKYWYTDMSTDELFATVYQKTASTIMHKSLTGADVGMVVAIGAIIIVLIIVLFRWWKAKVKRDKEKAAETERILNTPIDEIHETSDDLTSKYD